MQLEALEVRAVPATGIFTEDFTRDGAQRGGFDSARDGLWIMGQGTATKFVTTPNIDPVAGPKAGHSLQLTPPPGGIAQYTARIEHGSIAGQMNPWEVVTRASVWVNGPGTIAFVSRAHTVIEFVNSRPTGEWVKFEVTSETPDQFGQPFGQAALVVGISTSTMLMDDLTFEVGVGGPDTPDRPGVVRVNRFGNGLGITGDRFDNYVQVDLLYDEGGTIRVSGPGQATRIVAGPGAVQIDPYTVEVPDFAHPQKVNSGRFPDRDLLINLGGGDDQLLILGASWDASNPPPSLDDLIIKAGSGDSITQISNLHLWSALTFRSGSGQDTLGVFGKSRVRGLQVLTGAGADFVQFGTPGANVFAGEHPGDVDVQGENSVNISGVQRRVSVLDTGAGNDQVLLSGGLYESFAILLGSGSDSLRFESAIGLELEVRPGSMADLIQLFNSQVSITLFQDAADTIRPHHFIKDVTGVPIRLMGTAGVKIELPAGGTYYRQASFITPNPINEQTTRVTILDKIFGVTRPRKFDQTTEVEFIDPSAFPSYTI